MAHLTTLVGSQDPITFPQESAGTTDPATFIYEKMGEKKRRKKKEQRKL